MYDMIILNINSNIKYGYVYKVILEIEQFVDIEVNEKLDKRLDIKYKFLLSDGIGVR
jgi:hypothetical protein